MRHTILLIVACLAAVWATSAVGAPMKGSATMAIRGSITLAESKRPLDHTLRHAIEQSDEALASSLGGRYQGSEGWRRSGSCGGLEGWTRSVNGGLVPWFACWYRFTGVTVMNYGQVFDRYSYYTWSNGTSYCWGSYEKDIYPNATNWIWIGPVCTA